MDSQPECFKNRLPDQEDPFQSQVDPNDLGTLICLETLLGACYQSLADLVDGERIRHLCLRFERNTQIHQKELRRLFPLSQESEIAIDNKVYRYFLQLRPPVLFLDTVINLAISLTANKIDIYRYFFLNDRRHRKLLKQFIDDSKEEMNFLYRESNFHRNSIANTQLEGYYEKTILSSNRDKWGFVSRTAGRNSPGLCR